MSKSAIGQNSPVGMDLDMDMDSSLNLAKFGQKQDPQGDA
jgi:hypothetical protein